MSIRAYVNLPNSEKSIPRVAKNYKRDGTFPPRKRFFETVTVVM